MTRERISPALSHPRQDKKWQNHEHVEDSIKSQEQTHTQQILVENHKPFPILMIRFSTSSSFGRGKTCGGVFPLKCKFVRDDTCIHVCIYEGWGGEEKDTHAHKKKNIMSMCHNCSTPNGAEKLQPLCCKGTDACRMSENLPCTRIPSLQELVVECTCLCSRNGTAFQRELPFPTRPHRTAEQPIPETEARGKKKGKHTSEKIFPNDFVTF